MLLDPRTRYLTFHMSLDIFKSQGGDLLLH